MQIKQAADLLKSSKYAVALTGAGVSTPSGIPDFRSNKDGLWNKHNPMEIASLSAFRTKPESFYSWFRPLAKKILDANPNPAHFALASLENMKLLRSVITQNIDGLHQKAGTQKIQEVHGTMNTLTCVRCYSKHRASDFYVSYFKNGEAPTCMNCGGMLKPDVILFQEQLPRKIWRKAEKQIDKSDMMLVVGSSLEVNPVARLPYKVISGGGKLIIINEQPTYLDKRANVVIHADAAEILPDIIKELEK
jgi:NAD-dependent deacetylase